MLPTDQIQIFVEVAREGSLVAASRKLALPTSTVSRKLAELEQRLGKLVLRSTRKLSLTGQGVYYLEQFLPILERLDELEQETVQRNHQPSGTLRITAPFLYTLSRLEPQLSDFTRRHPKVRLQLHLSNEYLDLVGGGYDMAIRLGPLADSSLVARRIDSVRYRCCASPAYLRRHGAPHTPAELSAHRIIAITDRPGTVTWKFQSATGETRQTLLPHVAVNDPLYASKTCLADQGIAFLPEFLVQPEINHGSLVPLLEEWMPEQREVYAVYHQRGINSAALRVLVDSLVQDARA